MKRPLLAIALTLGLAAPAFGGWDELGEAFARGDYATVHAEALPLAMRI